MRQYRETDEYKRLLKQYNAMAKKADRQMRNLEKLSKEPGFENVLKYAYERAKKDIKSWTPPGGKISEHSPRWQRNVPLDTRSLKAKMKDIERFSSSPTATKRGIVQTYKNKVDAINKKYGTNFTWQQFQEFFDTGLREKTADKYGSQTTLYAIAKIQANKALVLKNFQEHKPTHLMIDDDIKVKDTINKLLHYYKKDLTDVLEG